MVNWINTCEHGLIALAAAFIAFNIALMNRLGKVASLLIAVGVSFPILLSRGPIYVFSQLYDVTSAVLIYTTAFLMLETLFYSVQSARDKRIITALQLVTISIAFFVDWLSYTLFAFWLAQPSGGRISRRGDAHETAQRDRPRSDPRECIHLVSGLALSCSRFPGEKDRACRLDRQLGIKILQRMNLTDEIRSRASSRPSSGTCIRSIIPTSPFR